MKNIGFLTESIDRSQKGTLISYELSSLINKRQDLNILLFFQLIRVPAQKISFGMMQNIQAWGFRGNFIAVDLPSALTILPLNCSGKNLYYPQDLDWLQYPNLAKFYSNIYDNDKIDLIARSKSHYDAITKVWKKPVALIEDFNHEQFTEVIDKYCI